VKILRLLCNNRMEILVLLQIFLLLVVLPAAAFSGQWEKFVRSESYEVSLDRNAVRLTISGRHALWLKFVPLAEANRRMAATEYKNKKYRWHTEYYEVDCLESIGKIGFTDIMGSDGKRLGRIRGEDVLEPIMPGSVLDSAAKLICPVVEESDGQDGDTVDEQQKHNSGDESAAADISAEAEKSIASALKRTETEPANQSAWAELGNAYYDADMPRQAIDAYNRALTMNPDDADVLNDQGAMFRQIGDVTQALKNFEKALAIDKYNLESLYNTGYIYAFDLNNIDRALTFWRRYLELDSTSETARQVQSFFERYSH